MDTAFAANISITNTNAVKGRLAVTGIVIRTFSGEGGAHITPIEQYSINNVLAQLQTLQIYHPITTLLYLQDTDLQIYVCLVHVVFNTGGMRK